MSDIGVTDLPEQRFLEALKDENWMTTKEREWFCDLYTFLWNRLYDDKTRWSDWWSQEKFVKDLPVVRTSRGIPQKPDEVLFPPSNEQEVELAAEIPGVLFVDGSLLKGNAQKLLEKLGVQAFSPESVVRTVILKGFEDGAWRSWNEEQLNKCVRFIMEWLKGREWKPPADLQRRLGAVRVKTEGNVLEQADKCYFLDQGLKALYPDASFIQLDESDDTQRGFLSALGVKDRPRLFVEDSNFERGQGPDFVPCWNEYWSWLSNRNYLAYSTGRQTLSNISCFECWGKIQWSSDVAKIVMDYLVRHWENDYKPYTNSYYKYYHRSNKTDKVPSYFAYQLLETKWLPTTQGLMKPSEKVFVPLPKIKKVAGDLVPYICISEGWEEQEFLSQGQEFFKFLGLRTAIDINGLKHLLEVVQKHSVDGLLKSYLSRIYQTLGRLLEEVNGNGIGRINLLTEVDIFENSSNLYWNDDRDLGGYFQGAEGIRFAWAPEDVERRYIEILFQKAGVKALSKHTQRKLIIPTNAESNTEQTNSFRGKARYIYSLLQHHKANKTDKAGEMLNTIEVKFSPHRLGVLLNLDGAERTVDTDVFYDIESKVLYLTGAEHFEIALEMGRVFGLDFGYISDLEVILCEENGKVIEKRLRRQGIALLNLEPPSLPDVTGTQPREQDDQEQQSSTGTLSGKRDGSMTSEGLGTSTTSPQPAISRTPVQRVELPYEERMKEEASSLKRIINFEESQGRRAEDVSKEHKGFDLESIDQQTCEIRYIEVKAPGFVMLTPHEYEVANSEEKRSSYYLYVVDKDSVYIIQDPANSCEVDKIETLETRWKILTWKEGAGEPIPL